jgi:hypothetical protein
MVNESWPDSALARPAALIWWEARALLAKGAYSAAAKSASDALAVDPDVIGGWAVLTEAAFRARLLRLVEVYTEGGTGAVGFHGDPGGE